MFITVCHLLSPPVLLQPLRNAYQSAIVCWQSPAPPRQWDGCPVDQSMTLIIALLGHCSTVNLFWLFSLFRLPSPPPSEKITINSLKHPERHENTPCNLEVTTSCLLYQNIFMAIPALSDWWKLEASNVVKFFLMLPLAKRPQQFLHCSILSPSLWAKALGSKEEGVRSSNQSNPFPEWFENMFRYWSLL